MSGPRGKGKPARHPLSTALQQALSKCECHVVAWADTVFRVSGSEYASREDVVTGEGAKSAGGRWNPPGLCRTVYTSLQADTAQAEYLAGFSNFGFAAASVKTPFTTVGIEVSVERLLDLTLPKVRRLLGVTVAEMIAPGWLVHQVGGEEPLTQAIGRLAFGAELEALIVPAAARRHDRNVLFFPGNFTPPRSYLRIVNRDKLPPPDIRKRP